MRWRRLNRSRLIEIGDEIVPDQKVEYLFYQALFGAWPLELAPDEPAGMQALAERIHRGGAFAAGMTAGEEPVASS